MPKAIHSARHRRLTELLITQRHAAGLTQTEVAHALGRHQSFIANIESGQRRLDVVEFLDLAAVIGLDAGAALADLRRRPSDRTAEIPRRRVRSVARRKD